MATKSLKSFLYLPPLDFGLQKPWYIHSHSHQSYGYDIVKKSMRSGVHFVISMRWADSQISFNGCGNHHVNGSHKSDSIHGEMKPRETGQQKSRVEMVKRQSKTLHYCENDVQGVENVQPWKNMKIVQKWPKTDLNMISLWSAKSRKNIK